MRLKRWISCGKLNYLNDERGSHLFTFDLEDFFFIHLVEFFFFFLTSDIKSIWCSNSPDFSSSLCNSTIVAFLYRLTFFLHILHLIVKKLFVIYPSVIQYSTTVTLVGYTLKWSEIFYFIFFNLVEVEINYIWVPSASVKDSIIE